MSDKIEDRHSTIVTRTIVIKIGHSDSALISTMMLLDILIVYRI